MGVMEGSSKLLEVEAGAGGWEIGVGFLRPNSFNTVDQIIESLDQQPATFEFYLPMI
jgi:hypothetical protein